MSQNFPIHFLNGSKTDSVPLVDRGLNYGDGLFETMRCIDQTVPLWDYHMERLTLGLEKLGFQRVSQLVAQFEAYVEQVLPSCEGQKLVKAVLTRGQSGRGYIPPKFVEPNIILSVYELPSYSAEYAAVGVKTRLCEYRLPINPRLSQIKHLNRLDQVLASQELDGEQEGILMDSNGYVIEGTKSNIIVCESGRFLTPDTSQSGVKGVLLSYLCNMPSNESDGIVQIEVDKIEIDRLLNCEGAYLVNSVFGIWPIRMIGGHILKIHPSYNAIKEHLSSRLAY